MLVNYPTPALSGLSCLSIRCVIARYMKVAEVTGSRSESLLNWRERESHARGRAPIHRSGKTIRPRDVLGSVNDHQHTREMTVDPKDQLPSVRTIRPAPGQPPKAAVEGAQHLLGTLALPYPARAQRPVPSMTRRLLSTRDLRRYCRVRRGGADSSAALICCAVMPSGCCRTASSITCKSSS